MSCPICQKKSEPQYRPFCSKRCADVDLGQWLTGGYAIPDDTEIVSPEAGAGATDTDRKPH